MSQVSWLGGPFPLILIPNAMVYAVSVLCLSEKTRLTQQTSVSRGFSTICHLVNAGGRVTALPHFRHP